MKVRLRFLFLGILWVSGSGKLAAEKETQVVRVVYEVFSLPTKEAAKARRLGKSDEELYQILLGGLNRGEVVLEKLMAARCRLGKNTMVAHTSEVISPSEFEPPALPFRNKTPESKRTDSKLDPKKRVIQNTEKPKGDIGSGIQLVPGLPASPTGFETRITGDSLEVVSSLGAGEDGVDLRYSVGHRSFLGKNILGDGLAEIQLPLFSKQGIKGVITQASGKPLLAGTVSQSVDSQEKKDESRVWLAFVTSTIVKVP